MNRENTRMRANIHAITICATAFLGLDAIWLTLMGPHLYRPAIGHLMRPDVNWTAVVLFYAVYVAGLLAFAVLPAARVRCAAIRGAGLGFVAYATYDLTCQATMMGWPWALTLADLAWGTLASGVACAVASVFTCRSGGR